MGIIFPSIGLLIWLGAASCWAATQDVARTFGYQPSLGRPLFEHIYSPFELLAAVLAYGKRGAANIDGLVKPLRRSLEADRFGFVAHVLAVRDGCTGLDCKALALLEDSARVRANLSVQTFDRYVEHYADIWAKTPDGQVADAGQQNAPPPHKMVNIDFPTAASIPPVSIMNPEPNGPVLPGVAAAAAANPNSQQATSPGPRRARKAAANAASPQAPSPPAAANAGPTEPIWPEPVPPTPGTSSPTASSANAPMQVAPPSQSAEKYKAATGPPAPARPLLPQPPPGPTAPPVRATCRSGPPSTALQAP